MLMLTVNGIHSWPAYPWEFSWALGTLITIFAYREPY